MKALIVINNLNDGQYLPDILDSLELQDTQNFRILGIDAGSIDNSFEVYKKYGVQIVDCTGLNQAESVNKAMKNLKEPFFAWINADDIYKPNFISSHLNIFKDPEIQIVYSECEIFYNLEEKHPYKTKKKNLKATFIKGQNPLYHPTTMIRSSLFDEIGNFDESFTYAFDYEFWSRAFSKGYKFGYIPSVTAGFRSRPDNLSHTKTEDIWKEIYRVHAMYGWSKK